MEKGDKNINIILFGSSQVGKTTFMHKCGNNESKESKDGELIEYMGFKYKGNKDG